MGYDQKLAKLFIMNFNEAFRSAKLLATSYQRISHLIPLDGETLTSLQIEDLDRLDAFRVRLCDLQDSMGSKIFRSLIALEEEQIGSQLDIINKMVKKGVLSSFELWKTLRDIRNSFSHDYPDDDNTRAESLTIAYQHTNSLLDVLNSIGHYAHKQIGISLDEFEEVKV